MNIDPRRRFTKTERSALYVHADGRCENCGHDLNDGFDADHITPHSHGGPTSLANGAALCPHCNRSKKDTTMNSTYRPAPLAPVNPSFRLRQWQEEAVPLMLAHESRSFLADVAPGGGKTIPALVAAREMIERGDVHRVVIVAPTDHLTRQWARAAHELGLNITPRWEGTGEPADMHGIAVTYQRVRHGAMALAVGCRVPTLVIADEPHDLGYARSWAEAFQAAFRDAVRTLLLSGTPFRSDGRAIPGVNYEAGVARADYTYSYSRAIADGVCRRVAFHTYDGQLRWISDNQRVEATFTIALSRKEASRRLRTALTPELSDGLRQMIGDAYAQLLEVREDHPDAAMLIVCESIQHAQATARIAETIIGQMPVLVASDDPEATKRIEQFRSSTAPCIVAVNMISEGVDIPRLRVGVYATPKNAPMLLPQSIRRFVRSGSGPDNACSHVFLPNDPELAQLALEIEKEIAHAIPDPEDLVLDEQGNEDGEEATVPPEDTGTSFMPLAFEPKSHDALLSGTLMPPEEAQWIDRLAQQRGVSPEEIARSLQNIGAGGTPAGSVADADDESPAYEVAETLRKRRHKLVARLHHLGGGDHPQINANVNARTAAGRPVKEQEVAQLEAGNEMLEQLIAAAGPSAA